MISGNLKPRFTSYELWEHLLKDKGLQKDIDSIVSDMKNAKLADDYCSNAEKSEVYMQIPGGRIVLNVVTTGEPNPLTALCAEKFYPIEGYELYYKIEGANDETKRKASEIMSKHCPTMHEYFEEMRRSASIRRLKKEKPQFF